MFPTEETLNNALGRRSIIWELRKANRGPICRICYKNSERVHRFQSMGRQAEGDSLPPGSTYKLPDAVKRNDLLHHAALFQRSRRSCEELLLRTDRNHNTQRFMKSGRLSPSRSCDRTRLLYRSPGQAGSCGSNTRARVRVEKIGDASNRRAVMPSSERFASQSRNSQRNHAGTNACAASRVNCDCIARWSLRSVLHSPLAT